MTAEAGAEAPQAPGCVAVAFCPHPPLLVPEVAAGAAAELDDLRAACDAAVASLLATGPDVVILVSGDEIDVTSGTASFAPWGVPLDVPLGAGGPPLLPLPLAIGAWLLARAGWTGPVRTGLRDAPPGAVALVLGDGSACRSTAAPGYLDPRAEPFDARVAAALGAADQAALAGLDPPPELQVAGIGAWRAAAALPGPWQGELTYAAAPYGVGYFVATWSHA